MKILHPPYPAWTRFDAVDPGRDYWAVATFEPYTRSMGPFKETRLVKVEIRRWDEPPFSRPLTLDPVTNLVIEMPQTYRNAKARLKDTDELIFSAGAIARGYSNVVRYTPAEWKGQIDKKTHHARILAALKPTERKIVDGLPKKDSIHVLDAVGLGLFYMMRIGR